MKAVVAAFNQEKALVGAFSVIVKTDCETDGSLHSTIPGGERAAQGGESDGRPAAQEVHGVVLSNHRQKLIFKQFQAVFFLRLKWRFVLYKQDNLCSIKTSSTVADK